MDGAAQAQLLLFAWAWLFFIGLLAHGASGLHPVVLVPGFGCSQLDARLTDEFEPASAAPSCGGALKRTKGWFRLWNNHTALLEDPALVPCYAELLQLVFDPVAGDYRNVPGVETRLMSFGTTRGFGYGDPAME
jgi:lysophospholipase-3